MSKFVEMWKIPKTTQALYTVCKLILCSIALISSTSLAQTTLSKESKVKAAYLFNFTKYIEWPQHTFDNGADILICVDEDKSFADFMRALVKNRKVGKDKRSVQILDLHSANRCHLTFIKTPIPGGLETLSSSVVVADAKTTLDNVTIQLFQQNGKLRFEIRMSEIERLQVAVSSELLKLARIR